MRICRDVAVALASVSLLLGMTACKKSETTGGAQVQQAVEASWDKSSPNALYAYVPEDSMAVMASTRQIDYKDEKIQNVVAFSLKFMQESIADQENILKVETPDSPRYLEAKAILDSYKPLVAMYSDMSKAMGELGLNAEGHFDAIFYMNGKTPVYKISVEDGEKFVSKFLSLLAPAYSATGKTMPTMQVIDVGGQKWQTFSIRDVLEGNSEFGCLLCENEKTLLPTLVAFHVEKAMVTAVIIDEGATATLPEYLKPAAKPMNPSVLGDVTASKLGVFMADLKAINDSVWSSILSRAGETEKAGVEVCANEFKSLAELFPKVLGYGGLDAHGKFVTSATLSLQDDASLKRLNAMTVAHSSIASSAKLAGLGLNVRLPEAMALVNELKRQVAVKNYQCEYLQDVDDVLEAASELFPADIVDLVSKVSSIQVALNDLDMANGRFDVVMGVGGSELSVSLPSLLSMGAILAGPEILVLNTPKDVVTNVDLSSIFGDKVQFAGLMTDPLYVIATANNDLKRIASLPQTTDGALFEFHIDTAIAPLLEETLSSLPNMHYGLSIGVNAEGIALTGYTEFKK